MPRKPTTRLAIDSPMGKNACAKESATALQTVPRVQRRWFIEEILPSEYEEQIGRENVGERFRWHFPSSVLAESYHRPRGNLPYRILVAREFDETMSKMLLGALVFLPIVDRGACARSNNKEKPSRCEPLTGAALALRWKDPLEKGAGSHRARSQIVAFEVRADAQRQGIGSALMRVVKRKHWALVIPLWKPSSESYYTRHGFVLEPNDSPTS